MGLSLFSRFAKPQKPQQNNALLTPLETFARSRGHTFHTDAELFYHNDAVHIPFLLLDRARGAYLFDVGPWKPEQLRSARAEKAPRHTNLTKDVDVDRANRIFQRKLDEIHHEKSCEVSNFLYLPHITQEAFEGLDDSFKKLIPRSRAIFADDSEEAIALKLADALPMRETLLDMAHLQSALFVQYTLLPDNLNDAFRQLTPQQKAYLHAALPKRSLLTGGYGSGKSSLILLKALTELLKNPSQSIAIVQPTQAACELLYQQLLRLIEYAVIHIDPTAIRIVTPQQICREHYQRTHKKPPLEEGNITDKMYAKALQVADTLFVDDVHLLDPRYRDYLWHIQKSGILHAASSEAYDDDTVSHRHHLPHAFRAPYSFSAYIDSAEPGDHGDTLQVMQGNGYILALHLLADLLQQFKHEEMLIAVPDEAFGKALREEITDFIGCTSILLDPHKSLLNQDMKQLLIVPIDGLSGLQRQHLVVIHDDRTPEALLKHAIGRAAERVYIIKHRSES